MRATQIFARELFVILRITPMPTSSQVINWVARIRGP